MTENHNDRKATGESYFKKLTGELGTVLQDGESSNLRLGGDFATFNSGLEEDSD